MLNRNEVKYIQSLYHKKNRDKESVFIAEGVKTITELIRSDFIIQNIYALEEWIDVHPTVKNVTEINETELKRISNFETPNKVLAVVQQKKKVNIPGLKNTVTLMLDGIQDPGNLGTIIRTADWFGIKSIITSNDTADIYNPKVVQATMGSITRVNIFYTDLASFLSTNKVVVYGAVLDGKDISSIKKIQEGVILIGNEGSGIRADVQPYIRQKISIPRIGHAESLNAAVATGIILAMLNEQ